MAFLCIRGLMSDDPSCDLTVYDYLSFHIDKVCALQNRACKAIQNDKYRKVCESVVCKNPGAMAVPSGRIRVGFSFHLHSATMRRVGWLSRLGTPMNALRRQVLSRSGTGSSDGKRWINFLLISESPKSSCMRVYNVGSRVVPPWASNVQQGPCPPNQEEAREVREPAPLQPQEQLLVKVPSEHARTNLSKRQLHQAVDHLINHNQKTNQQRSGSTLPIRKVQWSLRSGSQRRTQPGARPPYWKQPDKTMNTLKA